MLFILAKIGIMDKGFLEDIFLESPVFVKEIEIQLCFTDLFKR